MRKRFPLVNVIWLGAMILALLAWPYTSGNDAAAKSGARDRVQQSQKQTSDGPRYISVGSLKREYSLHFPLDYKSETTLPLVIMLHGGGGTGHATIEQIGWDKKSDEAGFILAAPEGNRADANRRARFIGNAQSWNDGSGRFYAGEHNIDDVAFIRAMVGEIQKNYKIDPNRIYVCGFSNGSSMAYRLGVEMADVFAAIAPVSSSGLRVSLGKLSSPVSAIIIHGAQDPRNPLAGGNVKFFGRKTDPRPDVETSVVRWAKALGCNLNPKVDTENGVTKKFFGGGQDGSEVVFYVIDDMGHTWPGGRAVLPQSLVGKTTNKLDATDVIWRFFLDHPKRR